jgi:MOSC domain-containing protein YiiM
MVLLSVNVGRPRLLAGEGQTVSSAIFKTPVAGPVELGVEGLEGDHQASRRVHGGPEMAVCVYPHEHYGYMAEKLGVELSPGAFGENFTTEGLLEEEVCIGDVMRVGHAVVQVSKPREPCVNLARRYRNPAIVRWITETCYTGCYLRVVETGYVEAGNRIELVERPHPGHTVADAMRAILSDRRSADLLEKFAACEGLSPKWRTRMAKRLTANRS